MRVERGIYENGVVSLPDAPALATKQEVAVLIPGAGEADALRTLRFAGMLADLSRQERGAFDKSIARGVSMEQAR